MVAARWNLARTGCGPLVQKVANTCISTYGHEIVAIDVHDLVYLICSKNTLKEVTKVLLSEHHRFLKTLQSLKLEQLLILFRISKYTGMNKDVVKEKKGVSS